jgi:hypothetical protein
MPDLIPDKYGFFDRHPVPTWIPAFAGMTTLRYLIAGVIKVENPQPTLHSVTLQSAGKAVSPDR